MEDRVAPRPPIPKSRVTAVGHPPARKFLGHSRTSAVTSTECTAPRRPSLLVHQNDGAAAPGETGDSAAPGRTGGPPLYFWRIRKVQRSISPKRVGVQRNSPKSMQPPRVQEFAGPRRCFTPTQSTASRLRAQVTPSLCTWEVIRTTGMCRHFDIAFLVVRRSGLIELLANTYSPNSHRSILPLANERSRTSTSQGDTSTLIMVPVHLGLFRARRFMELSDPVDAHWEYFSLITSRGVIVSSLVVQGRDRSRRSLDDWKFCRNPSS